MQKKPKQVYLSDPAENLQAISQEVILSSQDWHR